MHLYNAFVQIHLLCQLNPVPDQELISLGLWSPPSWITAMHLAIAFGKMWQLWVCLGTPMLHCYFVQFRMLIIMTWGCLFVKLFVSQIILSTLLDLIELANSWSLL